MWLIVGYALGVGEVAFSEEENVLWCHRDFVGTNFLESVNLVFGFHKLISRQAEEFELVHKPRKMGYQKRDHLNVP